MDGVSRVFPFPAAPKSVTVKPGTAPAARRQAAAKTTHPIFKAAVRLRSRRPVSCAAPSPIVVRKRCMCMSFALIEFPICSITRSAIPLRPETLNPSLRRPGRQEALDSPRNEGLSKTALQRAKTCPRRPERGTAGSLHGAGSGRTTSACRERWKRCFISR